MKKTKANGAAARSAAQIMLLRLNLNIADLLTMFVYTLSQIIWMITYQVNFTLKFSFLNFRACSEKILTRPKS